MFNIIQTNFGSQGLIGFKKLYKFEDAKNSIRLKRECESRGGRYRKCESIVQRCRSEKLKTGRLGFVRPSFRPRLFHPKDDSHTVIPSYFYTETLYALWSWVFLWKFTATQVVKKLSTFIEPKTHHGVRNNLSLDFAPSHQDSLIPSHPT
jgi:hypothetical protein